ncbi:MAG: hypothetical protein K2N54_07805, partial [Helicobacter sp.]|nr:hypothetical protein [Helicobacter sp.]
MSLLRGLFATALASVHLDMRDCRILLRFLKGGGVTFEEVKTFRCAPNTLPIEAAYYLSKIRRRHPFTYVATISNSLHQGALEGTGGEAGTQRIIIGKKWSIFISKNAISDDLDNFYRAPSLDFLYSPFLMLYQSIRSRLDGTKRLYVLLQQATVALLIMDSSRLYFSAIQAIESSTPTANSPADLESAPDPTAAGDAQNEEIGQLGDLDNVGEQKDFIEANEESQDALENQKRELEDFARVATATTILKDSIAEFYNNHSDSDFIAEVIVIDGTSMVQKAAEYLRSNLMIDTQILEVDMCQLIA